MQLFRGHPITLEFSSRTVIVTISDIKIVSGREIPVLYIVSAFRDRSSKVHFCYLYPNLDCVIRTLARYLNDLASNLKRPFRLNK